MKMKKKIMRRLLLWLAAALLLSVGVLSGLMFQIRHITSQATGELGTLYMSEMMLQMQDHFESIVELKTQEVQHIAAHVSGSDFGTTQKREILQAAARELNFEYLALYDEKGNYETVLGEAAWYRGGSAFVANVLEGKMVATTGYLTGDGDKYIVFGVPASHEMENGHTSAVLLAGFSVERLYDFINLNGTEQWGGNADVGIVLTNGSYVLRSEQVGKTSFYDHIRTMGNFLDMDVETGADSIQKAMARGSSFFCTISMGQEQVHMYGAPARAPEDWYFVLSMPQGALDEAVAFQSSSSVRAFVVAGAVILLLLLLVFVMYARFTMEQMAETEEAKIQAETASRAKSTFLFNASHDIRTPMNAIQGFANIIAAHPEDAELVRESVGKINQASSTLMQLLNDVLELSRIESGKLQLNPEPVDLYQHMEHLQTMFHQEMTDVGIDFRVETRVEHSGVLCDNLKLTQIMMNLLSNAKKFTPAGGKVTAGVEELESGQTWVLLRFWVQDTGIGMSKEFQERAFQQFERERTSTISRVQGSGLGLAIIKRLVDQMEGICTLQSKLGEGTLVSIQLELPLVELPDQKETGASEHEAQLKGRKVLLVEDNEFNREIIGYILEALGLQVSTAIHGADAIDTLADNPPNAFDVVLMDIQMPVMDGFRATELIRSQPDPARASIPIVAITANAFREDVERCLAVGMNGHVCKPVDPADLRKVLSAIFQ